MAILEPHWEPGLSGAETQVEKGTADLDGGTAPPLTSYRTTGYSLT
jgi:hypothetical protein